MLRHNSAAGEEDDEKERWSWPLISPSPTATEPSESPLCEEGLSTGKKSGDRDSQRGGGASEREREEPELRDGDGGLLRLVTRGSGNCRCLINNIVVLFFSFFFAMEAGVRSNLWWAQKTNEVIRQLVGSIRVVKFVEFVLCFRPVWMYQDPISEFLVLFGNCGEFCCYGGRECELSAFSSCRREYLTC